MKIIIASFGNFRFSDFAINLYYERTGILIDEKDSKLRTDPTMIEIVEELDDDASHEYSVLSVEEIDDDYENYWHISNHKNHENIEIDFISIIIDKIKFLFDSQNKKQKLINKINQIKIK